MVLPSVKNLVKHLSSLSSVSMTREFIFYWKNNINKNNFNDVVFINYNNKSNIFYFYNTYILYF
jgi:hypothetical protein